jgi:hypothetical protein
MSTIQILADRFYGGMEPIVKFYNDNRPANTEPLAVTRTCEPGFEIKLNPAELDDNMNWLKERGRLSDYNDTVRQVRIYGNGFLKSGYHMKLTDEENKLLFRALQHCLGKDKVIMV